MLSETLRNLTWAEHHIDEPQVAQTAFDASFSS
jgi:hypothetical protein